MLAWAMRVPRHALQQALHQELHAWPQDAAALLAGQTGADGRGMCTYQCV
jgi:hypothetical protein